MKFKLPVAWSLAILGILSCASVFAQAPQKFNYQAVVRNSAGETIESQSVTLRIGILSGSSSGTEVFSEEHSVTTNDFGLVSFQIGDGANQTGSMSGIDWSANSHYVEVGLDASGGTSFTTMGTSQLLAVPYALHAKTVENDEVDDADADPANEIQTLTFANDSLSISGGNSVVISFPMNNDNDSTNELQTLSIAGDTISLTEGGMVVLPPVAANNDNDSTNEIQALSISNDTVYLSDGGFVILPENHDNDSTNELQTISYANDTLSMDNGGGDVEIRESRWDDGIDAILYNGGTVGIGTDTADTNSSLDMGGMDRPMILPQMGLLDIFNMENPVEGMHVFCTTVGCPYYYSDSTWYSNCNASQGGGGGLLGGSSTSTSSGGSTNAHDYGRDVAVDEDGNSYVVGYFNGSATFGTTTLVSSGNADIFVAKVDTSGSFSWAVKMGGTNYDVGESIAVDDNGNIYVTGNYTSSGTFGGTTLSGSSYEVFLVKMNASTGAVTWAIDGGGSSNDYGRGVSVDGSGNVYVTGNFYGSATFGSHSESGHYDEVFVAKANSSGTWQWLTDAGGTYNQQGYDIATDNTGNSYVVGLYSADYTSYFGSYSIYSNRYQYYYYGAFIAKINTSGVWQWVNGTSGYYYGSEYMYSIAIDDNGGVYTCGYGGYYNFTYDGSSISSGATSGQTPFVMKVDAADGDLDWHKILESVDNTYNYNYPHGIAASDDGFVLVSGYTNYGVKIGSMEDAGNSNTTAYDPFMLLMTDEGEPLGLNVSTAEEASYISSCYGMGCDLESIGNGASTGYFRSSERDFGGNTVTNNGGNGYYDVFIWRVDIE